MLLSLVCLAKSRSYFLTKFHAKMTWHYYIMDTVVRLTAIFFNKVVLIHPWICVGSSMSDFVYHCTKM